MIGNDNVDGILGIADEITHDLGRIAPVEAHVGGGAQPLPRIAERGVSADQVLLERGVIRVDDRDVGPPEPPDVQTP